MKCHYILSRTLEILPNASNSNKYCSDPDITYYIENVFLSYYDKIHSLECC